MSGLEPDLTLEQIQEVIDGKRIYLREYPVNHASSPPAMRAVGYDVLRMLCNMASRLVKYVPAQPSSSASLMAEHLERCWPEIAKFFHERNWPDTKLGNAAACINADVDELIATLRGQRSAELDEAKRLLGEWMKRAAAHPEIQEFRGGYQPFLSRMTREFLNGR